MSKPQNIITKRLLELKGKMTLRAFSDKVGILQSTMHNYLHGRIPRGDMLQKIVLCTGVSANWLLGFNKNQDNIALAAIVMHIKAQRHETNEILKMFNLGYRK